MSLKSRITASFKRENFYWGIFSLGGIVCFILGLLSLIMIPRSDFFTISFTHSSIAYGFTIVTGIFLIGVTTKSKKIKRGLIFPFIIGGSLIIMGISGIISFSVNDTITATFSIIGMGVSYLMVGLTLEIYADDSIGSVVESLKEIKREFLND